MTNSDISGLMVSLEGRGLSAGSRNRILDRIRGLHSHCSAHGCFPESRMPKIPRVKGSKRREYDVISPELEAACRSFAANSGDYRDAVTWSFLEFAIQSGLRWSEQASLTDSDDLGDLLRVYASKTRTTRYVPISVRMREIIEAQREAKGASTYDTPLIFPNPWGRKWSHGHYHVKFWTPFRDRGPLPVTFRHHDARHNFGSRMASRGMPIPTLQQVMGHSSIEMTMRYVHSSPGYLDAARRFMDE